MVSCYSSSSRRGLSCAALGLALALWHSPHPAAAQTAVLTQNNDNARTGANTAEAALTPASVAGGSFGKLFTLAGLDASVNGQPLYVPHVTVGGVTRNVLYVYTSNNADHSPCGLNAFDADTGTPLWHTALPNSATYTTAAPVIDPATGTMYVLTKTDTDDTGQTFLRAFDIATGSEKPGSPVQVTASAAGTGDGSAGGRVAFDGPASSGRFHANDRAGLLLLNGVVYTAYAHNSDSFPYHGWVLGYRYDGTRFTQAASFCTTPNGSDGGIWQAGKGLAADAAGFLYCSVGNGTFDANVGGPDYGMCYLKLRASDLSVVDWFAPFDEQGLSSADLDLGNSGVVGLPGTTRLFGGATKFGSGFLLDGANLGHFTAKGSDKALLRLDGLTGNDSVGQNPVAWDAGGAKYVYLWANGSNVEQFRYDPSAGTFRPAGIYKQSVGLTSGGSLAVSSSGAVGGILWGVGADGVVRAFDASDVSKAPLWTSALNSGRDGLGSPGHFQFPTVVGGKVYVPTSGRTIAVYGLLAPPVIHTHILWTNPDGRTTLWFVNPDGSYGLVGAYGPYADSGGVWKAVAVATGPNGVSRILWTNPDGRATLWFVNLDGSYGVSGAYGPYTDTGGVWHAATVSVGPDNVAHILWTNPDGRATLWFVNADNTYGVLGAYGPYVDGGGVWRASAVATGPDNLSHLLWTNPDGRATLWFVNPNGSYGLVGAYGPYADGGGVWRALAVSVGPDNAAHLLWDNPDGRTTLWFINPDSSFGLVSAYARAADSGGAWSASALATGSDGVNHILWNNPDGRATLWSVNPGGGYGLTGAYGPYADSGGVWKAVADSAGP